MDLTSIPDGELQAEVERRAKLAPDQVSEPDWSGVQKYCAEYIGELAEGRGKPKDFEHYLFETVMTTCYGPDIFEWINKRL